MPIVGFPHNFIRGLSDFWQRFFADSDQLEAMYDGAAVLAGQAYLDMLGNVLNVALVDTPVFNKEYYKLIAIREDQVFYVPGTTPGSERWNYTLTDGVVRFASLDNRVIEPTAQLQEHIDYSLTASAVAFRVDPTSPNMDGVPLQGYAHRQLDIAVAGKVTDTVAAPFDSDFVVRGISKGDILRFVDVALGAVGRQRGLGDFPIVLVRPTALYLGGTAKPLAGTSNYVVLRQPYVPLVELEAFDPLSGAALAHTRLVIGTVKVFAKRPITGVEVVEGIDYTVDYEGGHIIKLTTWDASSLNRVSYEWMEEVFPYPGAVVGLVAPFYYSGLVSGATVVRVAQVALWAPDTLVDRFALSNNFGILIGRTGPSSESYRAFLLGIFQLYILGPVLTRIESALNVIWGLPVVRDDGELLVDVDLTGPNANIVRTKRLNGGVVEYSLPKATPIRPALLDSANWLVLTLQAFEPLTVAVTVTDYIQDPGWFHHTVIPREMFSEAEGATVPDIGRRTVTPQHVRHRIGAEDAPQIGDPGLYIGANEEGIVPPPGHATFRRRFAFVMMDRFFKTHMFYVNFDPALFSLVGEAARFKRVVDDLNDIILKAKPAHTYIYVAPSTTFVDHLAVYDAGYYQPQRGSTNPDAPEVYNDTTLLPSLTAPYVQLGLSFVAGVLGRDQVLFADHEPRIGGPLRVGDYAHYDSRTATITFTGLGVAMTMPNSPAAPKRGPLVQVFIDARMGGKHLVESVDYSVNYAARQITALTSWDAGLANVSVTFVQVILGNIADAAATLLDGDVPIIIGGHDPTIVRADYDATVKDLFDIPWPIADHRDISLVERSLQIKVIPA